MFEDKKAMSCVRDIYSRLEKNEELARNAETFAYAYPFHAKPITNRDVILAILDYLGAEVISSKPIEQHVSVAKKKEKRIRKG